jgi:hypothetical protein
MLIKKGRIEMLEGYAVYDDTGTIIPITVALSWCAGDMTERYVPSTLQDAVTRFFDKVAPEFVAGGWAKAEAAGYTVRKITINVQDNKIVVGK